MSTKIHLHHAQNSSLDDASQQVNTEGDAAGTTQDQSVDFATTAMPVAAFGESPPQALYLAEPGTTAAISVADINQGQLGDCFLLSSFGEEALFHPEAIANMIHDNGNGTETVILFVDAAGVLPTYASTAFSPVPVTIDNNFSAASVNNGPGQAVAGNLKEIWPQVIEKAVATLDGGYAAIASGGFPAMAMETLTGRAAISMPSGALTFAMLQNFVAFGDLITMDTAPQPGLPFGLVSNHAYMFTGLTGSGATAAVQLANPWGFDQPAAIPLAALASSGIVQVDIGHAA